MAAAVAAVLVSGAAMAQPALSDIVAVPRNHTINIMGSSAIKAALLANIQVDFCGNTFTNITPTGNSNFLGVSCVPAAGQVSTANAGSIFNVFIRYEGGSVSGYLPIVNHIGVDEINGSTLTTLTPVISGNSANNGADDSFGCTGCSFVKTLPDLAIGDVEPKALINANYPSAYLPSAWGPANGNGMFALASSPLVDEVYAVFINQTSGFTNGAAALNLTTQTLANIFNHKVTNWSQVVDMNGAPVGSGAITIVNREPGSGSRAATDILIAGDGCSSAGATSKIFETGATDYFSTGDVLAQAALTPGSITYATIDNSNTNLTQVNLNGVTPSNLAAALGTYPFWVEAQYINEAATTGATDSTAVQHIVAALQTLATTAGLKDIDVIPNVALATGGTGNAGAHLNPVGQVPTGGGVTVYINPYSRKNTTCGYPQQQTATP